MLRAVNLAVWGLGLRGKRVPSNSNDQDPSPATADKQAVGPCNDPRIRPEVLSNYPVSGKKGVDKPFSECGGRGRICQGTTNMEMR